MLPTQIQQLVRRLEILKNSSCSNDLSLEMLVAWRKIIRIKVKFEKLLIPSILFPWAIYTKWVSDK